MPRSSWSGQQKAVVLGNIATGGIAIIGDDPEKKLVSNGRTSGNERRVERESSSPTCCRERNEYPPGYTVFECRLDGNRPIAQVVQIPPTDGRDNPDKTCMILETKQSEFGPCARVAAYPDQRNQRNSKEASGGRSFLLESRDAGSSACAGKVAKSVEPSMVRPMTILETTKGCQNGPTSRLTYGPLNPIEKPAKCHQPSAFYIECSTGPKGPIARVTQLPKGCARSSKGPSTLYETFVKHDGAGPIATVTQCNEKALKDIEPPCEYLETRVGSSGPRAKARTLPECSSTVRHFTHLNVQACDNGPTARISQHFGDHRNSEFQARCKEIGGSSPVCGCYPSSAVRDQRKYQTCGSGKPLSGVKSAAERRNGLSPTRLELEGRVGPFKYSRVPGKIYHVEKTCQQPQSYEAPPYCPAQPETVLECLQKRLEPPVQPTCSCPVQPSSNYPYRPSTLMHPLPGGSVFSQLPAPSLPDIAPVPRGPNLLRDYKTQRPESTKPRKGTTRRKPRFDDKSNTLRKSSGKKTTASKKTGLGRKDRTPTPSSRDVRLQESPRVPSEKYVLCPVFASKGNQSDPARQETTCVQCPEEDAKSDESCTGEEPFYVECPTHRSKKESSSIVHVEPTYVRCPAYEIKEAKETDCAPRLNDLVNDYPEHIRAKTVETFLACRAKRNGLQDECRLHIPESVLRMSYEQRRNRHARTLVSCCTKRRRDHDDQPSRTEYCLRPRLSERSAKQNHRSNHRKDKPHPQQRKNDAEIENSQEQDSGKPKRTKHPLKAVKSRELRAGVVYYDCDCYHRNGLQQDCPRGGCGGLKHCVSKPWPKCTLSKYFTHKWGKYEDLLDLIPPSAFCGPRDALYKAKLGKYKDDEKDGNVGETDEHLRGKINGKNGSQHKQNNGKKSEKRDRTNENDVQRFVIIPVGRND